MANCFARGFSEGSKCVRTDLHLHTMSDKEFKWTSNKSTSNFVTEYIKKMIEQQIKIGAITNHNKFVQDEYMQLRQKAIDEEILLLPGLELSVNQGRNGLHMLIIFPPDAAENMPGENTSLIEKFITIAFGAKTRFDHNDNPCSCSLDIEGTIKELDKMKMPYFIILPHVDHDKGFFKELKGSPIKDMLRKGFFRKYILAFQDITHSKEKFELWLKEVAGEEKRSEDYYKPAYICASDPKGLDDVGRKYSCLKVGELSFEALKFALVQHQLRMPDACIFPVQNPHIRRVKIETEKMLKDTDVAFNMDMNNFIGIRGSGKSSLIEAIRYTMEEEPLADQEYKQNLIQFAVGSGGKVTIEVFVRGQKYLFERIYGEKTKVYRGEEYVPNLNPQKVLPVLYYGQKDLQKQVENRQLQLELIDQFIFEKLQPINLKIKEIEEKIKEIIYNLKSLHKKIERKQEFIEKKAALEEKIKVFIELQIANKLEKDANFKKDELVFERASSLLAAFKAQLNEFKNNITERYHAVYPIDSVENPGLFKELQGLIRELYNQWTSQLSSMELALNTASDKLLSIKNRFKEEKEKVQEEIARIKRDINVYEVSPDDYARLVKELEQTKILIYEIDKYEQKVSESTQQKDKFYGELQELWHKEWKAREEKAKAVNDLQELVKLTLIYKGDKEQFSLMLQSIFQGSGIRRDKLEKISNQFADGVEILHAMVNKDSLANIGFSEKEWLKFAERVKEQEENLTLMRIPDAMEIRYRGQLITNLSLGQRASSLLLLLLSIENMPVIIDQPEDDLDNQTVFQGLIKELIKLKGRRQIIFATHNPNIPVLGDCEQMVVFKYAEGKIDLETGSIDNRVIQERVVDIMEGGKEAFDKRKEIYNLWTP